MRGAGTRGFGALCAAALAAACGWPEYAFDAPSENGGQGGVGGHGGAGAPAGGTGNTSGSGGISGGGSGQGGEGGAAEPSCENGVVDGLETGVDCGGGTCPRCDEGDPCVVDIDCDHPVCTSRNVCELRSCADTLANGTETDMDCGGPDCERRCEPGDDCRTNSDCASALCQNGTCVPGTCDPLQGACGAPECLCANGRNCTTHENCASGSCAGGVCAQGARVFTRNDEPRAENVATPAILQTFMVRNGGPTALPLAELSIRYFFSSEGAADQRPGCDADRAVTPDACEGVTLSLFSSPRKTSFVDGFLEVRLGGGELEPMIGQTGEIPVTIEPSGGDLYEQSNDYSFAANAAFAANTKVTLYRRGVLIAGTEPPEAAGATTNVR